MLRVPGIEFFFSANHLSQSTIRVNRVALPASLSLPMFPNEQICSESVDMSQRCQQRKCPPHSFTSSASASGTAAR
jgi:hypothetical protein